MSPVSVLKEISMNFPNLEELSFLRVRALPNDSRRGFDESTRSSRDVMFLPSFSSCSLTGVATCLVIRAKYCIIIFVASVLPAPDSPLIIMLWLRIGCFRLWVYAPLFCMLNRASSSSRWAFSTFRTAEESKSEKARSATPNRWGGKQVVTLDAECVVIEDREFLYSIMSFSE